MVSKMELMYSSETSVDFQQITWRYIPGDGTFQNKNLRKTQLSLCAFNMQMNTDNLHVCHKYKLVPSLFYVLANNEDLQELWYLSWYQILRNAGIGNTPLATSVNFQYIKFILQWFFWCYHLAFSVFQVASYEQVSPQKFCSYVFFLLSIVATCQPLINPIIYI
jgi:hypothetical protein